MNSDKKMMTCEMFYGRLHGFLSELGDPSINNLRKSVIRKDISALMEV